MINIFNAFKVLLLVSVIISGLVLSGFMGQPDLKELQQYDIEKIENSSFNFPSLLIRILFFLMVFGAVAFLAYLTSRFYGKKARSFMIEGSRFIKVIDTISFGSNKMLVALKFLDEIILIGVGEKDIRLIHKIKDLEGDFDIEEEVIEKKPIDFKDYFNSLKKIFGKKSEHRNDTQLNSQVVNLQKRKDLFKKNGLLGEDEDEFRN